LAALQASKSSNTPVYLQKIKQKSISISYESTPFKGGVSASSGAQQYKKEP
jgi:hypothetical protein